MTEQNEIPCFPVTGWEIQIVPSRDMIMVKLPFLSHALQRLDEADAGRNYALTTAQALELRDALDRAVRKMQASDRTPKDPKQ